MRRRVFGWRSTSGGLRRPVFDCSGAASSARSAAEGDVPGLPQPTGCSILG